MGNSNKHNAQSKETSEYTEQVIFKRENTLSMKRHSFIQKLNTFCASAAVVFVLPVSDTFTEFLI